MVPLTMKQQNVSSFYETLNNPTSRNRLDARTISNYFDGYHFSCVLYPINISHLVRFRESTDCERVSDWQWRTFPFGIQPRLEDLAIKNIGYVVARLRRSAFTFCRRSTSIFCRRAFQTRCLINYTFKNHINYKALCEGNFNYTLRKVTVLSHI